MSMSLQSCRVWSKKEEVHEEEAEAVRGNRDRVTVRKPGGSTSTRVIRR